MKGARRTRKRQETGFADLMTPPSPNSGVITGVSRASPRATKTSPQQAKDDWGDLLTTEPKRKMSPRQPILPKRHTEHPEFRLEEEKPASAAVPAFLSGWDGADGWADDPVLEDSADEIDDEAWGWPEGGMKEQDPTETTAEESWITATESGEPVEKEVTVGSTGVPVKGSDSVVNSQSQPPAVRSPTEVVQDGTEHSDIANVDVQADTPQSIPAPLLGAEKEVPNTLLADTEMSQVSQEVAEASSATVDQHDHYAYSAKPTLVPPPQRDQVELEEQAGGETDKTVSPAVEQQFIQTSEAFGSFGLFDEKPADDVPSSQSQAGGWGALDGIEATTGPTNIPYTGVEKNAVESVEVVAQGVGEGTEGVLPTPSEPNVTLSEQATYSQADSTLTKRSVEAERFQDLPASSHQANKSNFKDSDGADVDIFAPKVEELPVKNDAFGGFAPFDESAFDTTPNSQSQADAWGAWDDIEIPQTEQVEFNVGEVSGVSHTVGEGEEQKIQENVGTGHRDISADTKTGTDESQSLAGNVVLGDVEIRSEEVPVPHGIKLEQMSEPQTEIETAFVPIDQKPIEPPSTLQTDIDGGGNTVLREETLEPASEKLSEISHRIDEEKAFPSSDPPVPPTTEAQANFEGWGLDGEDTVTAETDGWGWGEVSQNVEDSFSLTVEQAESRTSDPPEVPVEFTHSISPQTDEYQQETTDISSHGDENGLLGNNTQRQDVSEIASETIVIQEENLPPVSQPFQHETSIATNVNTSAQGTVAPQPSDGSDSREQNANGDVMYVNGGISNANESVDVSAGETAQWGNTEAELGESVATVEEGWGMEVRSTDVDVSSTIAGTDVPSVVAPSSVDENDFDAEQQHAPWESFPNVDVSTQQVQNGSGREYYSDNAHNAMSAEYDPFAAFGMNNQMSQAPNTGNCDLSDSNHNAEGNAHVGDAAIAMRDSEIQSDEQSLRYAGMKEDVPVTQETATPCTSATYAHEQEDVNTELGARSEAKDDANSNALPNSATEIFLPSAPQVPVGETESADPSIAAYAPQNVNVDTQPIGLGKPSDSAVDAGMYAPHSAHEDADNTEPPNDSMMPSMAPNDHVNEYWQQQLESAQDLNQAGGEKQYAVDQSVGEQAKAFETPQVSERSPQVPPESDSEKQEPHKAAFENHEDVWGAAWGSTKEATESSTYDPFASITSYETMPAQPGQDAFHIPGFQQDQTGNATWFQAGEPHVNETADMNATQHSNRESVKASEQEPSYDPLNENYGGEAAVQQPSDASANTTSNQTMEPTTTEDRDDQTKPDYYNDFSMYAPKQRPPMPSLQDAPSPDEFEASSFQNEKSHSQTGHEEAIDDAHRQDQSEQADFERSVDFGKPSEPRSDITHSFGYEGQDTNVQEDAYDPFAPTSEQLHSNTGMTEFGWGDFEVSSATAPTPDAQQPLQNVHDHGLNLISAPEPSNFGATEHVTSDRNVVNSGSAMPIDSHHRKEESIPSFNPNQQSHEEDECVVGSKPPSDELQSKHANEGTHETGIQQFAPQRYVPIISNSHDADQDFIQAPSSDPPPPPGPAMSPPDDAHLVTSESHSESISPSNYAPFVPRPQANPYAPMPNASQYTPNHVEPHVPELNSGAETTPPVPWVEQDKGTDIYNPMFTPVTNEENSNLMGLQDPPTAQYEQSTLPYPTSNNKPMDDVWNYNTPSSLGYPMESVPSSGYQLDNQLQGTLPQPREDGQVGSDAVQDQADTTQYYTAPPSTEQQQDSLYIPPPISAAYPTLTPSKTVGDDFIPDAYASSEPYAPSSNDMSSSAPLDTSFYSYPYSIMDPGASSELDHRPPRPALSWGIGGTLVAIFPTQNSNAADSQENDTSRQVHMYNLNEVAKDGAIDDWIAASEAVNPLQFPVKPRDLPQYAEMCDRLSRLSTGLNGSDAEGRAALWRLLGLMCRRGVADWRDEASSAITGPTSVPMFGAGSASYLAGRNVKDSPLKPSTLKPKSEHEQMAAASDVERLISNGQGRDAIQTAKDAGLWPLALVLAATVDRGSYLQTISDYARYHLNDGSALQTLCFSMAENDEEVIRKATSPSGLSEWRKTVGMLLTSRRSTTASDQARGGRFLKMIEQVGDALIAQKNDITAAHICYLISGRLASLDLSHIPLIGADVNLPCGRPKSMTSPAIVLQSLTYEAVTNTIRGETFPHLLPFRLVLAQEIAAVGRPDVALSHCEAISNAVRAIFEAKRGDIAAKFFTPPFLSSLESLEGRLGMYLDSTQSEEKVGTLSALGRSLSSVFSRSAPDQKDTVSGTRHRKRPSLSSVGSTPPLQPSALTQSVGQTQVPEYPQRQLPPTMQHENIPSSQPVVSIQQRDARSTPNLMQESMVPPEPKPEEDSSNKRWNSFVAKTVGMLAPADGDLSPPPRHRMGNPPFGQNKGPLGMSLNSGAGSRAPGQALETMHMRSASMGDVPNAMLHATSESMAGTFFDHTATSGPSPAQHGQAQFNRTRVEEPATSASSSTDAIHRRSTSDMTQASQTSEKKPPRPPKRSSTASMSALEKLQEQRPQAARGWRTRISERLKAAFGGPPRAHMGSENKFVYDKERGRWIIEGEEPEDEDDVAEPPPDDDAMFANDAHEVSSSTSYENLRAENIGKLTRSHSYSMQDSQSADFASQSPMGLGRGGLQATPYGSSTPDGFSNVDTASESSVTSGGSVPTSFSATPPRHPGSGAGNKYRAGRRTGRKAYVDTFNKGSSSGPPVPLPGRPSAVMPGALGPGGGGYSIFTPSPAQGSSNERQSNYGSRSAGEMPSNTSGVDGAGQQRAEPRLGVPGMSSPAIGSSPAMGSTGRSTPESERQANFQARPGPRMMA